MMKKWVFLLLVGLVLSPFGSGARDVTVYRVQVGAYNTLQEAELKAMEVRSKVAEQPVTVIELLQPFPFKVRVGFFDTYDQAKAAKEIYADQLGGAFVVSEVLSQSQAENLAVQPPETLYDRDRPLASEVTGLSERELIAQAEATVALAESKEERTERTVSMKEALPYLIAIAEDYPQSASADWARHQLGSQYLREYYGEQHARRVAGATRASATEDAAIGAALEHFEQLVTQYPDSPHAEQDAYQIASLTAALRKAGVQKDNEIRAI